ncbi:meckelin isoform X2 [Andrena cerasifolii]|uniref:meckelin isoform X2 n=1 Tax=Andrena cerasifolii TaxID=2819439 RepID=UPI004038137B
MSCIIQKGIISYFVVFYLNYHQIFVANNEIIEFSQPSRCKNNEYFNSALFTCSQCDTNENLKPSSDRLKCICNKFSKQTDLKNGHPVCTFCGTNTTISVDGKDCIPCNNEICYCNINEIQIDRDWNGALLDAMHCLPCTNNTYPSVDGSKCLSCNNFEYNYYITDIYTIKYYTWVQDYCLFKNSLSGQLNTSIRYLIKFEKQYVDSYYFRNELQAAVYFCEGKDILACQHLSNMCALSLYSNKIACTLFAEVQVPSTWLFYNKSENIAILNSNKITQKYSFLKYNNDSILNFTVATFSLRGNFKSIGTANMPCNLLEHVRFGINFKKKCKLMIKDLLRAEVELISPYIAYMENERNLLHALPILIKNINQNNSEMSHWQLVRKFFLIDNISGFKAIPDFIANKVEKASKLSVLRYMKSLTVIINVQNAEDKGTIHPPLLIIEYDELTHEQFVKTAEVMLDYKIKFTLTNNNVDFNFKIIIGVFSGLALIFSGIKTWNYSKQHHTSLSNIAVLFWFFIYAMGAVANVIILTLISTCIYLFIFYKGQTISYIPLLDDPNENTIKIFTTIAFVLKFVEVCGFICQYWNTDILFVDWEQPKPACNQYKYNPPDMCLSKLHTKNFLKDQYKSLQTSSEIITAKRKKMLHESDKRNSPKCFSKSVKYEANCSAVYSLSNNSVQEINEDYNFNKSPVSIWRTYFIANQWLKLQAERKTNVMIQLFAALGIFQIIQLYPWILAVQELTFQFSEENYNFILYYTVGTLIYVLIYCIQWLLSVAFYKQCIANRMQEFINLCSVTNISVFVLPFNYYGFYIHGRSVHGFADTDLLTLMSDIEKEKNNLCAHRGLVPGTTQQTFILSLTKTFRTVFMTLSKHTKAKSKNFLKRNYFSTANWEQNVSTRFKLTEFLCKFVDHCFKDVDYVIKEQHFFEKLYNNHSFNHVLFYGNEWLLATFEISVFTFMIVLYEDCTLATTCTILISTLLTMITKYTRKKNLSNNALLNKTFLT